MKDAIKITNMNPEGEETVVILDAENAFPVARLAPGESIVFPYKSRHIRGMGRMLLFNGEAPELSLPDNVVHLTQRG